MYTILHSPEFKTWETGFLESANREDQKSVMNIWRLDIISIKSSSQRKRATVSVPMIYSLRLPARCQILSENLLKSPTMAI